MGYGRLVYATGRDGVWPTPVNRLIGRIEPRTRSPLSATVIVCLVSVGMMLLGEERLLVLTSSENVFEFLLMGAAVLIGRRTGRTGVYFRSPLHPLVPVVGIAASAAMIVAQGFDPAAGRPSLLLVVGVFLASWAYYRVRMNHPSRAWSGRADLGVPSRRGGVLGRHIAPQLGPLVQGTNRLR
jgi:amino acid transporter